MTNGVDTPSAAYARLAEPGFSLVVHGWFRRSAGNPPGRVVSAQNQFPRETTTTPATRAAGARL